jgi:nucleoside-diphosphate-sugar epimerase
MSYWNNRPVLVTGGAGFIGHRLVAKLVVLGAKVTVIDDLSKGDKRNIEPYLEQIRFLPVDLLNPEVAKDCLKDQDICFHLAAKIGGIGYFHKKPATSLRDNSVMSFNLWDAAVGSDIKMVCLSSSMVFERTDTFPTPESAIETSPPPMSGYGFSKLVAEYIARTYNEEFGVKYVIVRPFNAYGPGEMCGEYVGYAHVIPDLVKKTLTGQYPLEILGSGKQTRSYTYVDDIADAILYVTERVENDDFNIGTGVETTVTELAEKIWKLCGRKEPLRFRHVPSLKYDVQRRIPDTSKIMRLDWKPKICLDEGLSKTVEWIRTETTRCAFNIE